MSVRSRLSSSFLRLFAWCSARAADIVVHVPRNVVHPPSLMRYRTKKRQFTAALPLRLWLSLAVRCVAVGSAGGQAHSSRKVWDLLRMTTTPCNRLAGGPLPVLNSVP